MIGVLGRWRVSKPAQQPFKTRNFLCRALMHWRNWEDAIPSRLSVSWVVAKAEGCGGAVG